MFGGMDGGSPRQLYEIMMVTATILNVTVMAGYRQGSELGLCEDITRS